MSEKSLLELKLENLPSNPGVYQFKDARGSVLYVGKAKRLKNRVKSYFQESKNHDGRIRIMISKIDDVELMVTDSEAEALMLEHNLIKQHQPRYNIMYRDDKSYPYICLTKGDRPRLFPTRTVLNDDSKYFGPYDSVVHMKRMLEMIAHTFKLCTCACSIKTIDKSRGMPKWGTCFGNYLGECSKEIPQDIYRDTLKQAEKLLTGKTDSLVRELKDEMLMASQTLAFEKAAMLRDGIESVTRFSQKMKMVTVDRIDRDIFVVETELEDNVGCGYLLKVRDGKVVGKMHRFITQIEGEKEAELLQAFVEDYYTGALAVTIPDEVLLHMDYEETEPLMEYLWQAHGKKVPVVIPKIGEKAQLVNLAKTNARHKIREWQLQKMKEKQERIPHSVQSLKRDLNLQRLPRRIECFDNSNLQGTDPVASMVSFVDGVSKKSEYLRFNIKTVVGPDDFASMKEILTRRYSRVMKMQLQIPDLIVVDGGKGQLSSAVEALKEIGFYGQCEIIGLAKRLEEVFFPGKSDAIMIPKTSSSIKLLQRVRDEAHRFAITFHREKRSKRTVTSELLEIDGIGSKLAEKMLKKFGSVVAISELSEGELAVEIGPQKAQKVREYFDAKSNDENIDT